METVTQNVVVLVGLLVVVLIVAYSYARREIEPPVDTKRDRQLRTAQSDLLEAEHQKEYYDAMVPLLRKRVVRLEKLQTAVDKTKAATRSEKVRAAALEVARRSANVNTVQGNVI